MNDNAQHDPRLYAIPDIHGHAKGEHKAFTDERPIPLSARMLFLWFYHACRRGWPRFMMVTDHMNYLTFEDPAAINLVRRALKLAQAGDLYGAAETASVEVGHAAIVSEGLRRGMRYSIGAEVDNDPRCRPDAQNIVDAMKPDGMIRSVHFLTIDHPAHGPNWNWPFDNPEFADVYELVGTAKTWELYMATLLDALERLPGNIVGHFYVPALFGHWPDDATLDGYENALVDACEARGMAIEFNTRFLYRDHSEEETAKYLAAHRRLLTKCKAKNVGIAVGSDAHSPKDQGGAFATVLALLDDCEINELVFPLAGRLARVALRVERKVEATQEPPLQTASSAEERRPARKARAVENSPREPAPVAHPDPEENAEPLKPKPRPKRSRAKALDPAEPESSAEDTAGDAALVAVFDSLPRPAAAGSNGISDADPVVDVAEPVVDVTVGETVITDVVAEMITVPDFEPLVTAALPESAEDDDADDVEPPLEDENDSIAIIVETAGTDSPVVLGAASDEGDREAEPAHGPLNKPAGEKTKGAAAKSKSGTAKPVSAAKKAAKPALKAAPKKAPVKKTPPKKAAVAKVSTKKAPAAKAAAKKGSSKKAAVRAKSAKKAAAKKDGAGAKKSSPKKSAPRRR